MAAALSCVNVSSLIFYWPAAVPDCVTIAHRPSRPCVGSSTPPRPPNGLTLAPLPPHGGLTLLASPTSHDPSSPWNPRFPGPVTQPAPSPTLAHPVAPPAPGGSLLDRLRRHRAPALRHGALQRGAVERDAGPGAEGPHGHLLHNRRRPQQVGRKGGGGERREAHNEAQRTMYWPYCSACSG